MTVFVNTCPQEMLEYDRRAWQDISGLEEHGVSYQTREMTVNPSLGLPINEVQTNVVEASRAIAFSGRSPLQEYIDGACSTIWLLVPITGREARFSRWIWLSNQVEQHEFSMD